MSRTEALIIGAGPVGLALAIGLRRHGVLVRIVDQAPGPTDEPRAAVIWPRGAEALADLGVGEAVRRAANELETVHFYSRGRRLGAAHLGGFDSAYPRPLMIEQHVTERILAARLEALGTRVEWNVRATRLHPCASGDAVEVQISMDGETAIIRSDWVVGCDSSRSFVREQLGVPFEGRPTPNLQLLQVDAVPRWRHPREDATGFYFLAPRACLGCFPVADGAYRFFCYTDDPDPAQAEPPTLAEMQALIARVAGAPELRLERPTWLNRARFQTRQAARLHIGRVLLAGDAAHVWPSIGGHGMNIGLLGAHNLAWKLAAVQQGRANAALLDTYEAEEKQAVGRFLRLMRFNWLERPGSRPGLLAREAALRVGLGLPGLSRWVERTVSGLDASHRGSALCGPEPRRGSPDVLGRVGDRVPNVGVFTTDLGSTRLHDCLSYERWTLLAPEGLPAEAHETLLSLFKPWQASIDLVRIRSINGARWDAGRAPTCVLVRPDGHIGLIAEDGDLAALRAYLDRWLRTAPARRQTGEATGSNRVRLRA